MNFFRTALVISAALFLVACGGGGGCSSGALCAAASGVTGTFTASPASAVSVAIGQGDTIETTAQEIKYKKRFAITVSDADGKPVVGAKVTAKILMVGFYKGRFFRNTTTFAITGKGTANPADPDNLVGAGPIEFCQSEDLNNNDVKDPGEDVNDDKVLTPARAEVVAVIEGSDITNAQGIVYIVVEYGKSTSTWIEYEIVANASVTGTEGRASKFQRTSYLVGDEIKPSTQFVNSPYGIFAGCGNRF